MIAQRCPKLPKTAWAVLDSFGQCWAIACLVLHVIELSGLGLGLERTRLGLGFIGVRLGLSGLDYITADNWAKRRAKFKWRVMGVGSPIRITYRLDDSSRKNAF